MGAGYSAGDKPHLIMSGIGKPDWFFTIFGRIQLQGEWGYEGA